MSQFSPATIRFLNDLRKNNEREWFNEHKDDYELLVREPALDFIAITLLDEEQLFDKGLPKLVASKFAAATPLMEFLCKAIDVKF